MDVKSISPARGKSGLQMGDIINEINGCNVTSRSDWRACIIENINPKSNHYTVNVLFFLFRFCQGNRKYYSTLYNNSCNMNFRKLVGAWNSKIDLF